MVHKKRGRSKKVERRSMSHHPHFWVMLSVAILVAGLSIITALNPFNITGNTVQTIGYMNKGAVLHLGVRDVPALELIYTNAVENIKSGQIEVKVDDSIPFSREYVSKFRVSSDGKFAPLQFNFKIKEQDLLAKGISRADLRLYKGTEEYELQLLKVNYGYLYYVVTVPSEGDFVLGRVTVLANETVTEKNQKSVKVPVQEQPAKPAEKLPENVVVGKAVEPSPAGSPAKGFFARIADFFRSLFSSN